MSRAPFELLELPDGRWCVARLAASTDDLAGTEPVGVYVSRDEAELAIDRAAPASGDPLAPFAPWMRRE
jgi:hypothetical protein